MQAQAMTFQERVAFNIAANEAFIKIIFPNEKFISDITEIKTKNKYIKGLIIPENVKVAESRIPINTEQSNTLRKELRMAKILTLSGDSIYLIPEPSKYKERVADAIINGIPYEFRNVENKVRKIETRFGDAKKKGTDINVFLNIDAEIDINEARRRVGLVLARHPEYTGKIIVSIKGGIPYFWDTNSFRQKNPLPFGRVRYPGRN